MSIHCVFKSFTHSRNNFWSFTVDVRINFSLSEYLNYRSLGSKPQTAERNWKHAEYGEREQPCAPIRLEWADYRHWPSPRRGLFASTVRSSSIDSQIDQPSYRIITPLIYSPIFLFLNYLFVLDFWIVLSFFKNENKIWSLEYHYKIITSLNFPKFRLHWIWGLKYSGTFKNDFFEPPN